MKKCNPKSEKAKDPAYKCNPLTGRWCLRKKSKVAKPPQAKQCNPKLAKAKDPAYECNPLTGRWCLRKDRKKKSIRRQATRQATHRVDRRLYKAPARNYMCMNGGNTDSIALENCPRNVKHIHLGSLLGEGTFGKVYKAKGVYHSSNLNLAVKVINNVNLDEIFDEVEYSYYMSEMDIGPKIYDAFYKLQESSYYIQYIIMEPFDGDVEELLRSKQVSLHNKRNAIKQMCILLYKQMFDHGLECYDIKPKNYVYKNHGNVVRMIDFGRDWCRTDRNKTPRSKHIVYLILLIQLAYMVNMFATSNPKVLDEFNNVPIFNKRMQYINEIDEEFSKNKDLFEIYVHYVRDGGLGDIRNEVKNVLKPIYKN
jgi:hypothetical protein